MMDGMIAIGRGLPVMFWIHGGGLINGSSTPYNPEANS